MKKAILVLLLVAAGATTVQAQKLKDLLYGGKLRSDSNSVVRKSDDLSTKIDTAQKKAVAAPMAPTSVDSTGNVSRPTPSPASTATGTVVATDTAGSAGVTVDTAASTETGVDAGPAPVKSNNRIWKEYSDSLVNTLKAEVLSNKKIKKETYYITVGYAIDTNGQVTVTNVTSTPENALLQAQIKQRIEVTPPPLNPILDSAGKPRKVNRNYNFTVTKD